MNKIQINKYMFLYLFLLFLTYFFYKDYNFFSDYLRNFSDYSKIDNLKLSKQVTFFSGTSLNAKYLDFADKLNYLILTKNFSEAQRLYFQKSSYNWKDFYNFANLNLIEWYFKLTNNQTGFVQNFQKSLSYYDLSLKLAPNYSFKIALTHNYNLAQNLLKFAYLYFCDSKFIELIQYSSKLVNLLNQLIPIFKQQVTALQKRKQVPQLRYCAISFINDANKNISLIYDNIDFFSKVKNWLINTLQDYVGKEDICYSKKNYFQEKYEKSLKSSLDYFQKFYKLNEDLLAVFENASFQQMQLLCKNKSKLGSNQSKANKDMEKNFKNLSDLLPKSQPHRKDKKQNPNQQAKNKDWQKAGEKKQAQTQKDKNKEWAMDKQFEQYTQDKLKYLLQQNKNLIQQIQKEKSQDIFNPKKYIDNLFKKFDGNIKYYDDVKKQSVGK